MASSASDCSTPSKKSKGPKRGLDFTEDKAYVGMIEVVEQLVKVNAGTSSGPIDTLILFREERRKAKQESLRKAKQVKEYA